MPDREVGLDTIDDSPENDVATLAMKTRAELTVPASLDSAAFILDADIQSRCDEMGAHGLVRDVLAMTSDRWSMLVISALSTGPVRFTGLMTAISGVSHRMLTQTLRRLQRDGLVSRTSYPESPPRVEYELTTLGASFSEPVQAFILWTLTHQEEIERSRNDFDR